MYKSKIIVFLLIILTAVFAVTACHMEPAAEVEKPASVKPEAKEEPAEEEPLPEEPEVVVITGRAAFDNVDVLFGRLDRGTEVHIVGENPVNSAFYDILFDYEGVSRSGKIEKRFVRAAGEEIPSSYEGTAGEAIKVYLSAYLDGEPAFEIAEGDKVIVEDSFGGVRFIKAGDREGYITEDAAVKTAEEEEKKDSGSKKSSGGSSKKKSGSEPSKEESKPAEKKEESEPKNESEGQDGGDLDVSGLSMIFPFDDYGIAPLAAETLTGEENGPADEMLGTVLTDEARIYSGYLEKGSSYELCCFDEGGVGVAVDDFTGNVPNWSILMEGDGAYKSRVLYAADGLACWDNYMLIGEPDAMESGQELIITDVTDGLSAVKTADGTFFIPTDVLAEHSSETAVAEEEEQEEEKQEKSSGKKDSGSKSGSKSEQKSEPKSEPAPAPAPAPEPEPEWTEPAM